MVDVYEMDYRSPYLKFLVSDLWNSKFCGKICFEF